MRTYFLTTSANFCWLIMPFAFGKLLFTTGRILWTRPPSWDGNRDIYFNMSGLYPSDAKSCHYIVQAIANAYFSIWHETSENPTIESIENTKNELLRRTAIPWGSPSILCPFMGKCANDVTSNWGNEKKPALNQSWTLQGHVLLF